MSQFRRCNVGVSLFFIRGVGVGHSGKDNFDRLASFHISGQIRKYLQQREGDLSSYAASTLVKVKADSLCARIVQ